METTAPTTPLFKQPRFIIGAIVGVSILLILGIGVLLIMNQQSQNPASTNMVVAPTDSMSADTGSEFLPAQTCPEQITTLNGSLAGVYNGKTYLVRGEDAEWVQANCEQRQEQTATKGIPMFTSSECIDRTTSGYTNALMNLNDLAHIVPLGRMFDSHVTPTDHQYWQPADPQAAWSTYNLYAPAEGHIISIGRTLPGQVTTVDQNVSTAETEYRVVLEHSCDFATILIHVHTLSDQILSQVQFDSSNNSGSIRIPVAAGELLGTVGGNTFDITTVDVTKKLTGFVNEQAYADSEPWKLYTADTIAYFAEPLRSQYYAKVSRSVEPISGKIDYDKDGYLVGNWFRQGTAGYSNNFSPRYWDGHLAFAYDHHNPSFIIVSTGHFLDGKSAQFMVDPNSPDPASVNSSTGLITYNLYEHYYTHADGTAWDMRSPAKDLTLQKKGDIQGKILVQVQPDKTIKVEVLGPTSNQTSFSGAAQSYTR